MREIKCLKCGEIMRNLGNVSGMIYTSYPEQWDDVYVCDKCKTKQNVRESATLPPDYSFLEGYESQNNY